MDSGLIFPHHRNLTRNDGDSEKACRLKVAGAQADAETSVKADPLKKPPGKVPANAKVPKYCLVERMFDFSDSDDVGLEAAVI